MRIVIWGAGGDIGYLGVQFAAKVGCEVVAVDLRDGPTGMIKTVVEELDAEERKLVHFVDAKKDSADEARKGRCGEPEEDLEGEKGCDSVTILPESQQAQEHGVNLLKNRSTCVIVSFPKEGFHLKPRYLIFRHIKMVWMFVGRNRQLRAMLSFAAKYNVKAKTKTKTKTYPLEKLNELVEDAHKGAGGKLVVDMKK